MDIEILNELYKEEFGKYPHGKASRETIINKLKAEGVDVGEPKEEIAVPAKIEKEKLKEVTFITDDITDEGLEFPLSEGRGGSTLYLVYFKGQPRQWTAASIQSMRSMREYIKFPNGTPYQEAATFSKCKNC